MKTAICACALILVTLAAVADETALKSLYDQHRWFELRDAIQSQTAPLLYKGAVASAFNDTKAAERYFHEAIKLDPKSAAGSQLWTRFADDFATLLKERGTKAKHQVTEVGGSNERDTIELPEIQLLVGGFRATLRPARVFAKPVGDDFHHGHLGLDVLSQAREVRLDFASMSLELLP